MAAAFILTTVLIFGLIASSHQGFGGTPEMKKCVSSARAKPDFHNQMLSDCVGFSLEDKMCLAGIPTKVSSMNTLLRALDCFSGVPKPMVKCSKPYYEWDGKRDEIIRNVRTKFSEVSSTDLIQIMETLSTKPDSTKAQLAAEYKHVPLELFDHLAGAGDITTKLHAAGKLCGDVLLSLDWAVRKRVEMLIWLKWQADEATNSKLDSSSSAAYQVYSNSPDTRRVKYFCLVPPVLLVLMFKVILG